jgi:hypothetical protein
MLAPVGAPLGTVQSLPGHCTHDTTREIYLHAIPEEQRRVMESIERFVFGAKWTQLGPKFLACSSRTSRSLVSTLACKATMASRLADWMIEALGRREHLMIITGSDYHPSSHAAVGRDYMDVYALRALTRLIPTMPSPAKPEPRSSNVLGSGTEAPPPPPPPPVVVPPAKPLLPDRLRMLEQPMETWFSIFEVGPCPANVT